MKHYISNLTKNTFSIFGWISFLALLLIINFSTTSWIIGIMGYGSGSDYTNPVSSFSWTVNIWTGETLTGATKVTLTQPVEVKSNSISVIIPNGSEITNASWDIFDTTQIATNVLPTLPLALPSNEQDVGKIVFWISGIKLNFSKPVKLQIPVSTSLSTVRIKVKHAGVSGYQTFALTDNLASNCFNGFATPSSNIASVVAGIATIYTCSASEFVAVTDIPIVTQPISSGWGGWVRLGKDNCPQGDFSPSYYDNTCGTPPTITKDSSLEQVTKELGNMVSTIKLQESIANQTTNEKIRFKYIVESRIQTAKYFGFEIKYIPTYDLSKNTVRLSMAIINNKNLTFDEKQRYINIINEFLVARYNYELAQTKHQILKNKYNKQTILLKNLMNKLGK